MQVQSHRSLIAYSAYSVIYLFIILYNIVLVIRIGIVVLSKPKQTLKRKKKLFP
jgi:hypothetical protein